MPYDLAFPSRGSLFLPQDETSVSRSSYLYRFVPQTATGLRWDQAR